MFIVIFFFVSFIVLDIILFIVRQYPLISEMQDILQQPFACPNCGHKFKIKMHRVWYRMPFFYIQNGFKVKCPNCKSVEFCRHSHL